MNPRSLILASVLVSFGIFSTWAVLQVGYVGLFLTALDNPGSMQIGLDLCLSLFLLSGFLVRDARKRGVASWPWLLAIPFAGSLAPLAYMLVREFRRSDGAA